MLKYLKKYKNRVLAILAIILVALVILFIYTLPSFQNCVCNIENYYANQPNHEHHSLCYISFRSHIGCIWHLIDRNSDAIIAIFTIVIGIFTGLLFTDGRGKTRKELRAYVGPASAYIRVVPGGLRIDIDIKNFGNTLAKNVVIKASASTPRVINAGVGKFGWGKGGDLGTTETSGSLRFLGAVDTETDIGVLMPSGVWNIYREIEAASVDDIDIDIIGRIEYNDVFGKPWWTTFKYIKGRMYRKEDGTIRGWDVKATPDGNDAT